MEYKGEERIGEELQGLIGFLPQEFGSYENMSSYEFLDYMALIKGIVDTKERADRIEYVLKAVHMWERKDDRIHWRKKGRFRRGGGGKEHTAGRRKRENSDTRQQVKRNRCEI